MLLIGSRAAQYHFNDFRAPKDYDFIATSQEVDSFLKKYKYIDTSKHSKKRRALIVLNNKKYSFEFDLVDSYKSNKMIYNNDFIYGQYDKLLNYSYAVASPSTLFMLKKCCVIFPIHWQKNMKDFIFFQKKSISLNGWQNRAYELRVEEIKSRHNFKEMDFDVSNESFFKRSERRVKRIMPHDSIHQATCFYNEPLFLSVKSDLNKAAMDEIKVNELPDELKIKLIQEECMALSLERYIIPKILKDEKYDIKYFYTKIASKMVYHYLPFFLRPFAAENFLKILDVDIVYVDKFLNSKEFYDKQRAIL